MLEGTFYPMVNSIRASYCLNSVFIRDAVSVEDFGNLVIMRNVDLAIYYQISNNLDFMGTVGPLTTYRH